MSSAASDVSASPPFKPTAAWVFRSPARIISFGFGSGLLRPGPGTWGTVLAWILWILIVARFSDAAVAGLLIVSFAYGCWSCDRVGKELGQPDHGGMVWDEIIAFWLVLWLTPGTWEAQSLAFILFRAFDIAKPPPIHFFDAHFKNGFGVMWDDIVAAIYTLLVMAILVLLERLL